MIYDNAIADSEHLAPSPPEVGRLADLAASTRPDWGYLFIQWRGSPRMCLCFRVKEPDELLPLDERAPVVPVIAAAKPAAGVGRVHPAPDGGIAHVEHPGDFGRRIDRRAVDGRG